MLLKDCPVGSVVRLVSFHNLTDWADRNWWWRGDFEVRHSASGKYIRTNDGDTYDEFLDDAFEFEIVGGLKENIDRTITINGKTYKLKPHTEPRLTVIDGVTYEMEEI